MTITVGSVNEFKTDRIHGVRPQKSDLENIITLRQNPEAAKTLGGIPTREKLVTKLQETLDHWKKHNFGVWMLRDKETNDFMGIGGLRHVMIEGVDEVELSYAFLPEYWGERAWH